MVAMRHLLLLSALSVVSACRTAPPPAQDLKDLEARVARLESRAPDLDDRILALEVERAALLATYDRGHDAVRRIDQRIAALERARAEEVRARRDHMRRELEARRAEALVTYSADHAIVRRLDVQIAFLE